MLCLLSEFYAKYEDGGENMRKVIATYECGECGLVYDKEFIDLVWWTVRKKIPPNPLTCDICQSNMRLVESEEIKI
jgi:hypothetical protein